MRFLGKYNVAGITITACDYEYALLKILYHAKKRKEYLVAPIASHSVALSQFDSELRYSLDKFDLIVPDSQYCRWALEFLYGVRLKDRVYGPELVVQLLKKASNENFSVFLCGNDIPNIKKSIESQFQSININGFVDLRFKKVNAKDIYRIKRSIQSKKPDIVILGIGSPLQQVLAPILSQNKFPVIAAGAAFDFISKNKPQAPTWMQDRGLEWLFRLIREPKRLWKRYLIYGTLFIAFVIAQKITMLNQTHYSKQFHATPFKMK